MSVFLVGLAVMIALALVFVLPPLLRTAQLVPADAAGDAARKANLQVLREQLAALDADLASGALDAQQHRVARIEIERRALEEEQETARPAVAARSGKTAVVVGGFVPLFAFVLYGLLGTPEAMLPRPPSQAVAGQPEGGAATADQIEVMVAKLANRLENQPTPQAGDDQAWAMLGRTYAVMQRFPEASRAFFRARELAPNNAQLMADHADVLAMLQGRTVVGEPALLAQRALQIEPDNLKALALLGSAAYERKDFSLALDLWTRARKIAEPGSDFAAGLDGSIQQARAAGGKESGAAPVAGVAAVTAAAPTVPAAPATKPVVPEPVATAAAAGPGKVSGVVQLAGPLAGKAAPGDILFVFARAAQGPRMPLAIVRMRVSDLPLNFTLDDSTAMSPEMKLSKFPSVIVGARISRSGDAMPRSGDLVGQVGPVETGSGKLRIMIDTVQP